jgi:hypothetical protein
MARGGAYNAEYRRIRRMALDPPVLCGRCVRRQATTLDHDPPLAMHAHRNGSGCCRLIPCCEECNRAGGQEVQIGTWRPDSSPVVTELEAEPERDGLTADDRCWAVPWLEDLRRVPADGGWPRLMTVPHPDAVDSLGAEFVAWAQARSGRPLRWWQRLVATRLLEVNRAGVLVWEALVLSMPRQLGKSWLLRELCLWRIHQADRFGEPQDVLHTGKDLSICKEVQRPARVWAKARAHQYRVREVNGQEEIEWLADGSRWMLRAKEAVYGYSVSLAAADEAWKVKQSSIEEGLTPTMAEREQPQLLLVSTAHRLATGLMLTRRKVALEALEVGTGDLLIEWSAPQTVDIEDRRAWRQASAHWTDRRERMIAARLEAAYAGQVEDVDEVDPIASFRAQWLNLWPRRIASPTGAVEPLLAEGLWGDLAEPGISSDGGLWVALEDDYGLGAAVAAIGRTDDGRLEVGGWLRPTWDDAVADVEALAATRPIRRLLVGASMLDRVAPTVRPAPRPAGGTETRLGLALIRDLAAAGELVHDVDTVELDIAVNAAQVRQGPAGLLLAARGHTHLVRAVVWALGVAHRPARSPAIR